MTATALVATAGIAQAVALAERAAREIGEGCTAELVSAEGVELVADELGTHPPLAGRALLVLECRAETALRDLLDGAAEVRGVTFAENEEERVELWSWRAGIPRALARAELRCQLTLDVPLVAVPGAFERTRSALSRFAPAALLVAYGSLLQSSTGVVVPGEHVARLVLAAALHEITPDDY